MVEQSKHRPRLTVFEFVVAGVLLGLVAIIAAPRFSRADEVPTEATLRMRLHLMRIAIERYRQDHDAYPGTAGDGVNPAETAEALAAQLTRYSDANGVTATERDARFRFGPYLKRGIPACPVVGSDGDSRVIVIDEDDATARESEGGWIYSLRSGTIRANSAGQDRRGRRHDAY